MWNRVICVASLICNKSYIVPGTIWSQVLYGTESYIEFYIVTGTIWNRVLYETKSYIVEVVGHIYAAKI